MATNYRNDRYAEKIQQKLEALDLQKGLGIFADAHYEAVPDTRFLIVSYGGTGADALEAVKTNLEKYMDKEDLETKVAFLAIDTDKTAQTKKITVKENGVETTKQVPRFGNAEFHWLNNQPGKQALMIGDAGMKQWINPQLKDKVEADKTLMDGNGASGIRQLGRAMLYPTGIIESFEDKFTVLVRRLTDNNGDNLKIFVLSGISGGTGSGIVVDATYLMHDFISKMAGGIPGRTEFAGFLLLPPTGTSDKQTDKTKGNRNGIAALKEIDRFMSIAQRKERYRANLGGRTLDIGENIFKTCYLLDGGTSNVAYSNAREKANTVVADCILDMITSLPIDDQGVQGNTQTVDAFMSDASTFAYAMLQTTSAKLAPREANYVYCALGHGKTLIPLNLMKAYVAKRLFDRMCLTFDNCSKVTGEQVKAFVREVKGFEVDGQLRDNLDQKLRPMFRNPDKGPYYVINLLNDAASELQREYDRLQASAFAFGKDNKLKMLDGLISQLRQMNNSTFKVYVTVMEEMKRYLNQEHGIICNSNLLERYGGSTYTFCPIDFGGTDEKSAVVKQYLDGLVNQGNVDKLVNGLLDEMDAHRKEWTDLAERTQPGQKQGFDAVKRIRAFWQKSIGDIVKATVEDYLLKLYSGNPKASWPKNGQQPDAQTEKAMQDAAKAIVEQMWGAAGIAKPLADLRTNILTMPKFNGHNTLLIPQAAPNLRRYVQAEAANQANNMNELVVAGSRVDDRISCYAQYTGIPAYMFGWVEKAEPDYEKLLSTANVGLHMSETRGGEQWANFPNLMVETIWPMSVPAYDNPREHGFGLLAKKAFEEARALGLAQELAGNQVGIGNYYYYKLYSLPKTNLPDRLLLKDVDIEIEGRTAHKQAVATLEAEVEAKAEDIFKLAANWANEGPVTRKDIYEVLLNKGQAFENRELRFTETVMAVSADEVEPKGWPEELAARLLRTLPYYLDEVRETVMVLNKAYEKIEKAQASKKLMREFSHYCAAGLFAFEPDDAVWSYWDEIEEEEKILVELIGIDDAQIKAKEYFLYKAFEENAEEIIRAVQPKYRKMIFKEESDKNPNNALLKEMQARSHALRDEVAALRTAKDGIASQAFAKLARQQEHSDQTIEQIRAFYKAFENELDAARMQVLT